MNKWKWGHTYWLAWTLLERCSTGSEEYLLDFLRTSRASPEGKPDEPRSFVHFSERLVCCRRGAVVLPSWNCFQLWPDCEWIYRDRCELRSRTQYHCWSRLACGGTPIPTVVGVEQRGEGFLIIMCSSQPTNLKTNKDFISARARSCKPILVLLLLFSYFLDAPAIGSQDSFFQRQVFQQATLFHKIFRKSIWEIRASHFLISPPTHSVSL